jgi:purine nucleosidase
LERPFVLDTDIGTDVDDLWALAMTPALVGASFAAVTTVSGDTALRARLAAVACALLGVTPQIAAGERVALSGRPAFWAGHEGEGIAGLADAPFDTSADAVTVLRRLAAAHPGQLEVVAIGPLTNLATAILSDPAFAGRIRHLYVMGGDFRSETPRPEHNFGSDAVATWTVLHAGIPTTICGYEITTQVLLGEPDLPRIERSGPAGPLLADQSRRFWRWHDTWAPPESRRASPPHDPMALLTAFRPELFRFEAVHVEAVGLGTNSGMVRAAPDPGSHIRVVREAAVADVKESILTALATDAR